MTSKEFNEMVALFLKLDKLMKKYEQELTPKEEILDEPTEIMFPTDVYDEICDKLNIKELGLIGIS
jgi:hypothetical protein